MIDADCLFLITFLAQDQESSGSSPDETTRYSTTYHENLIGGFFILLGFWLIPLFLLEAVID